MTHPSYVIRPVRPSDVPAVVAMVHELAHFERAPEQCHLTEAQLAGSLFGELASRNSKPSGELASRNSKPSGELASRNSKPSGELASRSGQHSGELASRTDKPNGESPALFGHVAADTGTDEPFGFSLWFLNYSTWEGSHGIYLEDLYVRPEARGTGAGRALLAALADICLERGYRRLDWWVLTWNPAREFYESLGATAMDEWVPYRIEGTALHTLVATGSRQDPVDHELRGAQKR